MTDITTTHLKCLLDQATPGPWEERDNYLDDGTRPDDSYQMSGAAGDYLGIMHGQDAHLAAAAPELAEEVIRLREQVKGLILAMETKAATGESQSPAIIAGYLKEKVLGDHDEH